MTELLLETGLTSSQRKYAETVQRSGKNLLGIINDLLDFSKIEAGKLELENVDMDLRRTIEDVVDLLAERAHSKGLELACSIPADLVTHVRGDPLRLGQILTNLVGNAIKFTDQGSVVIRVASVEETAKKATMRFEVSDTGAGISLEAQSRIFDEFSQADGSTTRKHGGSGLGLAISKELVEMMGGNIHVESALGAGSTFWFTGTFEKQEAQGAAQDVRTAPMGMLTGVRALIVESSTANRGILQAQMSNWGMSNRVAATPEQALDLLSQAAARGASYDIAIMDLGLPGMDTLDLARQIRSRNDLGRVRLVMLTRRQADVRSAREAGVDACLAKPVRQTMLYECLVNVMAGQAQEAVAAPAVSEPAKVPAGMRGNILLVEDNLINQQVALGILQIQGYNVTVANHGREALDAHAQGAFDLILMDCHMPEMDGFEATREIRGRERASPGRHVPIIALTANAMAQDREACLNAGMDDHLSKPFSMLTLQEMLNRWTPKTPQAESTASAPAPAAQAARAAANSTQVIDRQVLDQLGKVRTNGKPELLTRVIKLYLVESPKLIQKLKQAANAANAPEMASQAHSLKSSSANVGAKVLSRYCEDLEQSARRADTEEARRILAKVESEHGSVQAALKAESEQLTAKA
jgi:CheY-like chemotaxis protein